MSKKKKKFVRPTGNKKLETRNPKLNVTNNESLVEKSGDKLEITETQEAQVEARSINERGLRGIKTHETTVVKREIKKIFFLLVFFVVVIVGLYFADQKMDLVQKIVDKAVQIYN